MRCADSSLLVPMLAEWHARHADANAAIAGDVVAVGHAMVEAYAVLTRLPEPYRVPQAMAADALSRLVDSVIVLDADETRQVAARLDAAGVSGGATSDGLIALTAQRHGATLVTLDERAVRTYRACGVDFQLVDS